MPGYMDPDLCDLVFDVVHDIVELQKHTYLDDAVVKSTKFFQLAVNVLH
jgi:hypothetical protein